MSRCIGCGAKIQTTNPEKIGYVPEIAMIERGEQVYCKRCYDIRHHNALYTPEYDTKMYYDKIKNIKDENALVILMIDIMDIFGGFIPNLSEYIGNNKVLIVVNKIDVLPKSVNIKKFEELISLISKRKKLNVVGIMMISARKQDDVEKVIARISKLKYAAKKKYNHEKEVRFDNCYIIGCASVGKSTFMNMIGKITLNYPSDVITTSNQYQTTQDFIKWPLDQKSYLIDTPGFINPSHYGAYIDNKSLQVLIPKKYIKVRTYQLNPDQTIFIGGLAKIKFYGENKINVSFYISNELYLHRTKTIQADKILETQQFKLLVPPYTEEEALKLNEKAVYNYEITGTSDIFISGIGFIHITSEKCNVEVQVPKPILVEKIDGFM